MPRWDGVYGEYAPNGRRVWNYSRANQVPTLLSLLTPEYQQRMVRQIYHEGVNAAHQWSASYCWPEGFMRQWATGPKPSRIVVTPEVVLFMGSGSGNMWRVVHLGREFPLGQGVPQWYGDTIGFWDGDALITWTANIQGWNQHSSWEWSDRLETIEILTPVRDASGKFLGLDWEAVLYDSEALVTPVRILWHRNYQQGWGTADRLGWVECTRPFIRSMDTRLRSRPGRSSNTRFPTCSIVPGPGSGKSISRRTWTGRSRNSISVSNENGVGSHLMRTVLGGTMIAVDNAGTTSTQIVATVVAVLSLALLPPHADAHHSYTMYDGAVYRVFTGVIVRVVPNAAHFEMHFVPLNDARDALVRDEKGQPLVWVAQMESAAQAFKDGITRESFPQGTVFSMGLHPRRDGKPAGDRGMSGLFQCPKGSKPEPGKHCDSVAGNKTFGAGEIPKETVPRS